MFEPVEAALFRGDGEALGLGGSFNPPAAPAGGLDGGAVVTGGGCDSVRPAVPELTASNIVLSLAAALPPPEKSFDALDALGVARTVPPSASASIDALDVLPPRRWPGAFTKTVSFAGGEFGSLSKSEDDPLPSPGRCAGEAGVFGDFAPELLGAASACGRLLGDRTVPVL